MIFVYDKESKDIKFFYTCDCNYLNSLDNSNNISIKFDDDINVINNPLNYRIVFYNEQPVLIAEKPVITFSLNKDRIINDGIDSAILTVNISNLHPLDSFTNIPLLINNKLTNITIENNIGEIEITSITEGKVIISVGSNMFEYKPIILEVI